MEKKAITLLRVPEVAKRLAIKESSVRKMISEKRLDVVRIGRTVSVPEDFIEKLIFSGYSPALSEDRK